METNDMNVVKCRYTDREGEAGYSTADTAEKDRFKAGTQPQGPQHQHWIYFKYFAKHHLDQDIAVIPK